MSYRLDNLKAVRLATGVSATAAIGAGAHGVVTTTVTEKGPDGNRFTIRTVLGTGISQPLAAAASPILDSAGFARGTAITVTLATDGAEAPNDAANTATLIAAAVDALDGVTAVASGTGATAISTAIGAVTFAGGRFPYTIQDVARMSVFGVARLQQVEQGRPVLEHEALRIAGALSTTLNGLGAAAL